MNSYSRAIDVANRLDLDQKQCGPIGPTQSSAAASAGSRLTGPARRPRFKQHGLPPLLNRSLQPGTTLRAHPSSSQIKARHSSARTSEIAPGTGSLGPETRGRNCPTSANGDRHLSERRRKTPPIAGLSPRSLQNAKTADWLVADAVEANPSPGKNREFSENFGPKQAIGELKAEGRSKFDSNPC